MAKKKEETNVQVSGQLTEGQQEPPKQSQRERYMQRRKEAYPDVNEDDEDAYYGRANDDLDELENYRETNKALADTFDKTPTLAGMLLAAKEGVNPYVYLAEQGGPDLDFRELVKDPDFNKKMSEALDKFQQAQLKSNQEMDDSKKNFTQTFAALKEIQQERGMSDEECMELIKKMYGDPDNNEDIGIFGLASRGIVTKETWDAILKAQNYDGDIASARKKAGAQAMNERIQNPLKTFDGEELPPTLNSGGAGGEGKPEKKTSFFGDWEREEGL